MILFLPPHLGSPPFFCKCPKCLWVPLSLYLPFLKTSGGNYDVFYEGGPLLCAHDKKFSASQNWGYAVHVHTSPKNGDLKLKSVSALMPQRDIRMSRQSDAAAKNKNRREQQLLRFVADGGGILLPFSHM